MPTPYVVAFNHMLTHLHASYQQANIVLLWARVSLRNKVNHKVHGYLEYTLFNGEECLMWQDFTDSNT